MKLGWMQKCLETYDNNINIVGKVVNENAMLCPLYFITQKAQIEITMNGEGNFLAAKAIEKGNEDTLIAVSEKSESRSCGIAPHSLCDQLCYICLGNEKYPNFEEFEEKYKAYTSILESWANSDDSHYIVRAVNAYVKSGNMISDLAKSGVIKIDERGVLVKGNINAKPYEKCLVRWRVNSVGETGGECWTDITLFKSYQAFYEKNMLVGRTDICYVTGDKDFIPKNHPKGIVRLHANAKLLSSNDENGFTFRGRFRNKLEAFAVGIIASEKAHSALCWLVANQGAAFGGRTFVCWNAENKKCANAFNPFGKSIEDDSEEITTEPLYKQKLKNCINGYKNAFSGGIDDGVQIIGLDAATEGRLSVTYYNELNGSDYLSRIEKWYEDCIWWTLGFTNEKKPYYKVESPLPLDIVQFAYGTQQSNFVKADEKLLKDKMQEMLYCIIDGSPVSFGLSHALVQHCATPKSYTDFNYRKLLFIACAVYKKYIKNKYGKEIKMELDLDCKDRSYLFGRLLAVAEKVERSTFDFDVKREPNAVRLLAAYVQHPMHTWAILENALNPYYARLKPGSRKYYKDLIGEIVSSLDNIDVAKFNQPLEDIYLIGYYLQRKEFNSFNKKDPEEDK